MQTIQTEPLFYVPSVLHLFLKHPLPLYITSQIQVISVTLLNQTCSVGENINIIREHWNAAIILHVVRGKARNNHRRMKFSVPPSECKPNS